MQLVSILIPVYNRVSIVGATIESAINQTYSNIEIIIVDNCSTDGTWELLQEYVYKDDRIRIFKNGENIGPVRNWKRCIEEAKGEYAKLLFSDDLISNNFIEETIAVFDSETSFVLAGIEILDLETKKIISYSEFQYFEKIATETYLKDCCYENKIGFPVSPGSAIFRTIDLQRNLFLNIPNTDNLDHSKNGAGIDQLIFLKTALNYKYIKCVNKRLCTFYAHENSFTIASQGRLNIYYDWALFYFITNFRNQYLPFFKAAVIIKKMKYKHRYTNIFTSLYDQRFSVKFFLIKLSSKFFKR